MCTRLVDRKYALPLAVALAWFAAPDPARAQGYPSKFEFGRPASAQDSAAVAIAVAPDGKGLPPGKGDYATGKQVYENACSACHGANLQGVVGLPDMPAGAALRLIGGRGTLTSKNPVITVESYWPYATTLFDYVRRAMPFQAPGAAKPGNVLSPDAALDRLIKGNDRYVAGVSKRHDFKHEREALVAGQNPFAGILSCADSRIAPEYAFDTGRGDLFVCRVAGNVTNNDVVASLEYAVAVLNTPLFMVLGHMSCGAVDAAIKSIKDGTTLPGHLPSLVEALSPAV